MRGFFEKSRVSKIISCVILNVFILTGISVKGYASEDLLRPAAIAARDGGSGRSKIKEELKTTDGGSLVPKTVTVAAGHIFGPKVSIDFGIKDNIWSIGELTLSGQIKTGGDRTLDEGELSLKKLFKDQKAIIDFLAQNGNQTAYRMFRDLFLSEADKEIIRANKLRCDITVVPPLKVGDEFIKTTGHYHPSQDDPNRKNSALAKPGIDKSYTEVYVVLSGKAVYYLQKIDKDGNVVDAVEIHAKAGDIVPIPSTYGHITVNPSADQSLVMMNWVSDEFSSTYGEIINLNGGAYYFVEDKGQIKAVLNPAYKGKVADIKEGIVDDNLAKLIGLPKDKPVYDVIKRSGDLKNLVDFLNLPGSTGDSQYDAILGRISTSEKINILDKRFENAFNAFSGVKYDAFVNSLKAVKAENQGALVIGAQTILENAGVLSSLKKIKDSKVGIKIAVWAQDKKTAAKLILMGVDEVADIITNEGISDALSQLRKNGIANINMVLINAPGDIANINGAIKARKLIESELAETKSINVKTPTASEKEAGVNTMPLVVARAVTGILQNEPTVVKEYKDLSREYKNNDHISAEDLAKLNDLTSSITEMPLVKTTEEVAQAQITYETTVNKI